MAFLSTADNLTLSSGNETRIFFVIRQIVIKA